ncbi:MAG TPA: (d)CMP kinase [Longimicrobiales bacterium]|nr:(d)CMP kinase [Longimicrobiales bacterium]
MIIAIDGPAGSGKSSTAQAVAKALGFRHLDSGAFYRALTLAALRADVPPDRWPALDADQLETLNVTAVPGGNGFIMLLDGSPVGQEIRSPNVTAHVSDMARVPAVRDWLMDSLRAAARTADLVADGRDIGTVVFPDADLKIFLVADPGERARRRLLQTGTEPTPDALRAEVARMEARDRADASRETAPLRQADDARVLDTTGLSFDQQVARIVAWAREVADTAPGTSRQPAD